MKLMENNDALTSAEMFNLFKIKYRALLLQAKEDLVYFKKEKVSYEKNKELNNMLALHDNFPLIEWFDDFRNKSDIRVKIAAIKKGQTYDNIRNYFIKNISAYRKICRTIIDLGNDIIKYQSYLKINDAVFKRILNDYNVQSRDAIIKDGYCHNLGPKVGRIRAVVMDRIKKSVDFEISNRIKKQLIEEGVELYNKDTGQGRKWLVFRDNKEVVKFQYLRTNRIAKNYIFKPTYGRGVTGATGAINLLNRYVEENPNVKNKYARVERKYQKEHGTKLS